MCDLHIIVLPHAAWGATAVAHLLPKQQRWFLRIFQILIPSRPSSVAYGALPS